MPEKVLVIYTGGTIGSKPKDRTDPESPQIVVPWDELKAATPEIDDLGFSVDAISTPEPLDSCNIGPTEWKFMAETIEQNYFDYAGFVIPHGTDTMVYTASALSFMLRNLGKPVICTGAQRSAMVSVRNDATQNFITALLLANPTFSKIPVIPEVVIYFGGKILRGNRTIKMDTVGYDAYASPNLAPLGEVGDQITINSTLLQPEPDGKFFARTRIDTNVLPILVYPGIQNTTLVQRQLDDEALRAATVLSFGSGNIPTKPEFLAAFTEARDRGVVIANVGQCPRGPVELGIYETSAALLNAGFVAGNDITIEAAQCKLMVALGNPDLDDDRLTVAERRAIVEREFEIAQAGEQSVSVQLTPFAGGGGRIDTTADPVPGRHRIRGELVRGQFAPAAVSRALIRLRGVEIVSDGEVDIKVFLNLDPDAPPDQSDPGFGGMFRKDPEYQSGLVVLDVTGAFRSTVRPGDRVSATIVVGTAGTVLSWTDSELAVFINEAANR